MPASVCKADPDAASNKIVWKSGHTRAVQHQEKADCEQDHYSNKTLSDNKTDVQCTENGWEVLYPCVRGEEGSPERT